MTKSFSAKALWVTGQGEAILTDQQVHQRQGDVLVKTYYSGISRGTESLVFNGSVPPSQYSLMRAPFQEGHFPGPVKYGYSVAGRVAEGAEKGQAVFCLHPHQNLFAVPEGGLYRIPDSVPLRRAVLAPMMETALNALWDGKALPGLRFAVVGGGLIGLLVAYLLAKLPGTETTLFDIRPTRAALANAFGCQFVDPTMTDGQSPRADHDVVFHCSSTEAGLRTALGLVGDQASLVELSWFGDKAPCVPLGEAFHSQRLVLRSSQVGRVPPELAPRWTTQRRMNKALELLADPLLESLLAPDIAFRDLPEEMARIVDPSYDVLCQPVAYKQD